MKKIIFILCLLFSFSAKCQLDDLFKFSTFYGALGVNNALFSQGQYVMENNELIDLTRENPHDFSLNIGIRKIARFKYQNKKNNFYDGSEKYNTDNALIGAVKGLEYKFQLETKRQQGREFRNKHYFLRYLSNYYVIKAEHLENGLADVRFYNIDSRFRVKIGNKLNLTFGGLNTWRPLGYEYNAMAAYQAAGNAWDQLAFDYGYEDHYWYFDGEGNGQDDWYDYWNWYWTNPDGDRIAETDQEFYKYHYGRIVRQYQIDVQDSLGLTHEFSLAVGLSLYHYSDDFWIHGWADVFPKRWLMDDIDEDVLQYIELNNDRIDYNIGLIIGTRLGKKNNFGLFVEGNYNQMWERNWFNIKTGINYLFF